MSIRCVLVFVVLTAIFVAGVVAIIRTLFGGP